MTQSEARIPGNPQAEASVNKLRSLETPFQGRLILVTGGSSGTGLATAEAAHRLGADVIIGTRSEKRFAEAKDRIGERVTPLIADLSTPEAGVAAAEGLILSGMIPTDIILSAAGGMESFLKPIATDLLRLQRADSEEAKESRIKTIQGKIATGTIEHWSGAQGINFEGQKAFIETLIPHLKPGAKIIDYSSLWSSIYGREGANIPNFYKIIAGTKHMMEDWMDTHGRELADKGIYTGIVSGHLITDSETGRMLDRFLLPLLTLEDRATITEGTISMKDMVDPTVDLINSDGSVWNSYPLKVYVFGPGPQVTSELSVNHPLFGIKFPIDSSGETEQTEKPLEVIDAEALLKTWYGTPDAIGIQTLQRVEYLGIPMGVGRSVVSQEQIDYPQRLAMVDTLEVIEEGKTVGKVDVTPEKSRGHLNAENGFPLLFPGHKQIRSAIETVQLMEREFGNSHFSRLRSFDLAQFTKGVLADGTQKLTVVPELVMRDEGGATYNVTIVDQDGKQTAKIDNLTVSYMHGENPPVLQEDFMIEAAAQTAGVALLPEESVNPDIMPLFGQVGPVEFSGIMLKEGAEVEYYVAGEGSEKGIDAKMIRIISNNEEVGKIEGVKAIVAPRRLAFRMIGYKPPVAPATN